MKNLGEILILPQKCVRIISKIWSAVGIVAREEVLRSFGDGLFIQVSSS